jgi:hypothetical protein
MEVKLKLEDHECPMHLGIGKLYKTVGKVIQSMKTHERCEAKLRTECFKTDQVMIDELKLNPNYVL